MRQIEYNFPPGLKDLPDKVKKFFLKKYEEEGLAWLGLSNEQIINEYEKEKNKTVKGKKRLIKNEELRIREAHRLKSDIIKRANDLMRERGFSENDFKLELQITNRELRPEIFSPELEIDFDKTIKKLIKESKLNEVDVRGINFDDFKTRKKGKHKQTAYLVDFDKHVSSFNVVEELDKLGFRPAELHELLEFAIQFPDSKRKRVVAFDACCKDERGNVCVLFIGSCGNSLCSYFWGYGWDKSFCFLAFRK